MIDAPHGVVTACQLFQEAFLQPIEVFSLSRRDSIDTVCQTLEQSSPGAQVWLVAPWGAGMSRRLLNLRRLKRVADRVGFDLRFVSGHTNTRLLARDAGLETYVTLPLALRKYRRRLRVEQSPLARRRVTVEASAHRRRKRGLTLGGVLVALLTIALLGAALGASVLALAPSAEVVIRPVSRPVATVFRVTADPMYRQVDYGRAVAPARWVQVSSEVRGEEPASGGMDVADGYASGEVIFGNRTDQAILVPQGTIVRTGSGVNVRFATLTPVEVPAQLYGLARAAIVALEPGMGGNVGALTINTVEGERGYAVSVLNTGPTQGGTMRRVPLVTEDDFVRLRSRLMAQLQQQAYDELVAELEAGEFIPVQSLEMIPLAAVHDQVLGQRSPVASMTLKLVVRGIAVKGAVIDDLAVQLLERDSEDQELHIIRDSLQVVRSEEIAWDGDKMLIDVQARGMVASVVNTQVVQRGIRGKRVGDAMAWLEENIALAAPPSIDVLPDWWDRLPWLPGRLKLQVSAGGL